MALISLWVRIVSIHDLVKQNQHLRVADSTFGLVFEVGRDVLLKQFEPIHDVALRGA